MAEKPVRLDIMPSVDLRRAIDQWRAEQSWLHLPSRAEAARRLIEIGLRAEKVLPPKEASP